MREELRVLNPPSLGVFISHITRVVLFIQWRIKKPLLYTVTEIPEKKTWN